VVYLQLQEEGFFRVWSVRYLVGDGWQAPECIQSASDDESCTEPINAGDAWKAQVAVAPDGGAVAIWQQTDLSNPDLGVREVVWSNRFSPSGGWVGARMVAPNELNSLFAPAVTIDAAGNAIAVWEQLDGTRSNIRSRRQADSGEWIDEQPVELAQENAFAPRVVSDDAGNAIAVWQQQTSSGSPEIWANRLLPSTGSWESAELIGPTEEGDAGAPRIAIDANGNVVAVWAQNGGPSAGVWSNRYDAGAGWRAPALISPRGLGPGRSPDVAISPSGRAVVVWVQFDGNTDRVWSNRSTTGGAWGRSESVPAPDEETRASGPHVAVDSMGRATAVWLSRSGVESAADLYSSRLE
jgi:hypothetical protein